PELEAVDPAPQPFLGADAQDERAIVAGLELQGPHAPQALAHGAHRGVPEGSQLLADPLDLQGLKGPAPHPQQQLVTHLGAPIRLDADGRPVGAHVDLDPRRRRAGHEAHQTENEEREDAHSSAWPRGGRQHRPSPMPMFAPSGPSLRPPPAQSTSPWVAAAVRSAMNWLGTRYRSSTSVGFSWSTPGSTRSVKVRGAWPL